MGKLAAILNEINRSDLDSGSDMTAVEIAKKYKIDQGSAIKIKKRINTARSLGIKLGAIEKLTEIDTLIENKQREMGVIEINTRHPPGLPKSALKEDFISAAKSYALEVLRQSSNTDLAEYIKQIKNEKLKQEWESCHAEATISLRNFSEIGDLSIFEGMKIVVTTVLILKSETHSESRRLDMSNEILAISFDIISDILKLNTSAFDTRKQ